MNPPPTDPASDGPSYGNLSDRHWSRTRQGTNLEAIEYYRERSKAPGVADGGAERNFYCMKCDGVIPFDVKGERCPHCSAPIDEHIRRYFNWVEINEPPRGDAAALLRVAAVVVAIGALVAGTLWICLR